MVFDKGFGETVAQDEMFKHFGKLAGDRLSINIAGSDKRGVMAALNSEPPSHMYYFFCHGYTPAGEPKCRREFVNGLRDILKHGKVPIQQRDVWDRVLDLITESGDESWIYTGSAQIRENELRREPFFPEPPDQLRPIIFLNMCQSAALMPSMTTGFVRLFLDHGAEAVIGTESPMTSVFADAFARELLGHFLRGSDLGTSLLQARRHFFADEFRNPLGLAYTLYGRATAKIGSRPLLGAD